MRIAAPVRICIAGGIAALGAALGACGPESATSRTPQAPRQALLSTPEGSVGRIEVRELEARPRLALVAREGDPAPAIVAAVATDLGPAATVALASVVEARLRAAGFEVDASADRGAFRVRALVPGQGRAATLLGALAAAFAQPIAPGGPELALARQRLQALRAAPLEAPELAPIAACTGRLGLAGAEQVPDLGTAAGARELEAWRRAALHAGRTSLAAVGPAAFCDEVAAALVRADDWPRGDAPADPWPQADATAAFPSIDLGGRSARVTVAARVSSALAAASAAERLGAPGSPLRARLAALGTPWETVEVLGVARPRGGCVSVTAEAPELPAGQATETAAAMVAAMVRQEIRAELAAPAGPAVVSRQILTAAEPRDAGARASWWALSSVAPERPERWATALALPPRRDPPVKGAPEATPGKRFEAELARALAPAAQPAVERRTLVERGQGEVWVLLASPCGVVEEGNQDAGVTALAALSAVHQRRDGGVTLEPWVTADGVGVIAHAPIGDGVESPADLARRVATEAARTLAGTAPEPAALSHARAAALGHLERSGGPEAAALGVFAAAIAPDHPSWIEPFGLWERVAGSPLTAARHRWQALASGPLRAAILANADATQAAAAAAAIDRWLAPRPGQRTCGVAEPGAPRPGRHAARLPREAAFAQTLLGVSIPAGPGGREAARLTAAALEGPGGLLASLAPAAGASARIVGGARASALLVEVRAPAAQIADASARARELLLGLAQRVTEADLARAEAALARREREARADPRRRVMDLWRDQPVAGGAGRTTLPAWRAWLAAALSEAALITVEARPE